MSYLNGYYKSLNNLNMRKHTTNILLLLFLTFIGISELTAQEVISTSGGSFSGNSINVDWTLGETVTSTFISEDVIVTQGFHQSNLTVNAVDLLSDYGIMVKVYPNPVPDILIIENKNTELKDITLRLFDISGKMLIDKSVSEKKEDLNMQIYKPGNYLLKIYTENDLPVQYFKIIKK